MLAAAKAGRLKKLQPDERPLVPPLVEDEGDESQAALTTSQGQRTGQGGARGGGVDHLRACAQADGDAGQGQGHEGGAD